MWKIDRGGKMKVTTEAADLSKNDRNSGQGMQLRPQISNVDVQVQHEIEQFYYREAWLLDNRKFKEWFALLDDDIRYFMPLRTSRIQREGALEFSGEATCTRMELASTPSR